MSLTHFPNFSDAPEDETPKWESYVVRHNRIILFVSLVLCLSGVYAAYLVGLSRANPPYAVAIATYLPGAVALGAGLVRRSRDPLTRGAATIALAGLGLTFGAAAVQVRRIAVHPRLFDHNATYHTIQAIALACFFAAARRFSGVPGD
jgi:uncharacterized membrane protein HdeD (DUF308 family)